MNDEPTNDYPDCGLLGAWVAVVESESVSHAARRLGLSQAAVSMRVKMLEGKLGTDLLDRGTRPAKVTLAGQRLYETRTELLKGADEMLENVRGISRARRAVARPGCPDLVAAAGGAGAVWCRWLGGWGRCCTAPCRAPRSRCGCGRA